MNATEIKRRILANPYVDTVRGEMRVDSSAFTELRRLLHELASELHGELVIDRELAGVLYSIPLMIRNTRLSFTGAGLPMPEIADLLEDQWVELDALVLACLTGDEEEY